MSSRVRCPPVSCWVNHNKSRELEFRVVAEKIVRRVCTDLGVNVSYGLRVAAALLKECEGVLQTTSQLLLILQW